jgi:hypothetical protein
MSAPRTCIIGAGISGLTSGKICSDYRIPYDCFEISDRVGGNWAFQNPNGMSSAYRSLHIDTSKELLSFRDFPMPEDYPDFPHHSQIKDYLDAYADAFGLRERIHFSNGVEHAERRENGGWTVMTQDGRERAYDVLVVANGHHWDPRYPDFPGEFHGETIHSHHYIDPTEPLSLTGRRILVVGIGNSAADITSELSQASLGNEVFLSTRSGAWVLPKYAFGKPIDQVVKPNPSIPPRIQAKMARWLPLVLSGRPESYGLPHPDHEFGQAHPTVSSELLVRLGSGDAVAKPNVERLEGDRVRFKDGSVEEIDVIIYATGYKISFPFFDPQFLSAPDNRLPLYKRMLHPDIDDLVFVGFAQTVPTLFPFVENQARLLGAYLTGNYRPPDAARMREVIAADQQRHGGHYKAKPRHTMQVDYYSYVHQMLTEELPEGRERVERYGPVPLAGRADDEHDDVREAMAGA